MRKLRIEEKIDISLNLSWELFLKTSDSDAQDLIADRDGGQSKEGRREERRKSGKRRILVLDLIQLELDQEKKQWNRTR